MRGDRTTKLLLALIALGIWALTIFQVGIPVAGAESSATTTESAVAEPASTAAQADGSIGGDHTTRTVTGPAPLPLRWHVDYAGVQTGTWYNTYCTSLVVVRNLTGGVVRVQVEWFEFEGASLGYTQVDVIAGGRGVVVANQTDIKSHPFSGSYDSALGEFHGYANVHADDPRVHASANLICRDGTGSSTHIVAITSIGTSPVGSSREFFLAGSPGGWSPAVTGDRPE
jgi:hypothetical protein